MIGAFKHTLKKLLRANDGIAFVEFALTVPIVLALLMGAVEISRYILITQKTEKVSSTIADVVSQSQNISTAQMDQIITAAGQIMKPYDFTVGGYVIVSSVTKVGSATPTVKWQYTSTRGSALAPQTSHIGNVGNAATLPSSFTMLNDENVIFTEVFFAFTPIVPGFIMGNSVMYRFSVFKPRLGDLSTLS